MEKRDWLDELNNRGTINFEASLADTPQWNPLQKTVVCLNDVVASFIHWLFYPYIAVGKITLLEGDPGVGKSWILLAMAVAVSIGKGLFGNESYEPGNVLLLSAEDGLSDTIKHRLEKMGGDHTKIFAVKVPLVLNEDGLKKIEEVITEIKPKLVTIDPLVAYLGGDVDLHRANETRQVMSHLAYLAERYECSIVALRHLTKGGKEKAIYRGLGSIDFLAAVRSALLVGHDPRDKNKRAIVHLKSNIGPLGDSYGYTIQDGEFQWTGPSDLTAAQIHSADPSADTSALDEAKDFLTEKLSGGRAPSRELMEEAKARGISEKTFRRASKALGVKSESEGIPGKKGAGVWYLRLVPQPSEIPAPPERQSPMATPEDSDGQTPQTENKANLIPGQEPPTDNSPKQDGGLSEDEYDKI